MTLIEMIVSITIISISVTGSMLVITQVGRSSADPMIRTQAGAIAQAYMDEIQVQPLSDPDGGETGGPETGETRSTYDDVTDYHGLNDSTGARDQMGALIPGLDGYNVAVNVAAVTLGSYPAQRIQVTITHDGNADFSLPLATYRMN